MKAKENLIVALDVGKIDRAMKLIEILSPEIDIFKIGIAPFTDFGNIIVEELQKRRKKVFLDLKFHDIPNTVAAAARAAARKGIYMMNFHCLGGARMLEAAARGAKEGCRETGKNMPILLGVTILTSMEQEDMESVGFKGEVKDRVLDLARLAKEAGLDGAVASAKEATAIKQQIGNDFIIVTPGVRPRWAQAKDQKRILTPKEAIGQGADYIVVGRPIIEDKEPQEAARKILQEMKE